MKEDPKREYNGDFGVIMYLGSLKVIGNVTISQTASDFPFTFQRNCASILYRFRNTASCWKLHFLSHMYLAPPLWCRLGIHHDMSRQKCIVRVASEMYSTELLRGVVSVII